MLYNVLVYISCTLISTHKTTVSILRAPPVTLSPLLIQVSSNLKCLWPLTMLTTPFLKFILPFLLEHQTLSIFLLSLWLLLLSFLLLPATFPFIPKYWHVPESCLQTPFFSRHFPHFRYSFSLILSILLFSTTIINCEKVTQLSSPSLCPTKLQVHLNNNFLESFTWIFHRHLILYKS